MGIAPSWESSNKFFRTGNYCPGIQHFRYSHTLSYPDHSHNEISVVICLEGSVESTQIGRREFLRPGEVVITNRETVHSSRYGLGGQVSEGVTIDLDLETFAQILQFSALPVPVAVENSIFLGKVKVEAVPAMAKALLDEIAARRFGYERVVEALAGRIGIEVLRSWPRKAIVPVQNKMRAQLPRWEFIKVIEYMHTCTKEEFRLQTLCRDLGFSASRFSRLFSNTTGQSPLNCYNELLMDRAALMLRGQGRSVKDVAYSLGFKRVSHFCSLFKMIHGASPTGFCKTQLEDCFESPAVSYLPARRASPA